MDILGGQAVQVTRLLRRLRELDGIEVSFLAVNPRLPGPLRLLQRIKDLRTIATSIVYGLSLLKNIRTSDVVHAFSASYTSYLLAPLPAMLVAKLYGKRIVLNYRSGEASDHLARSSFAVRTMRLADEIVVPSGYLVEVFAQFGLHARAILNFVDLDNLDYRERAEDAAGVPEQQEISSRCTTSAVRCAHSPSSSSNCQTRASWSSATAASVRRSRRLHASWV